MNNGVLSDYAYYVTDRVDASSLSPKTYVGVDNLLPNRAGRVDSEYVPNEGSATQFKIGDVLIGNIRPYFKKVWLADRNGGCSNDVFVIRSKGFVKPLFLYVLLSTDHFFDYDMAGSKGSKMPRGDKGHIMRYPVSIPDSQEGIGTFIDNINQKVSINNAICADIEGLAKLLYDYWFIQFDFPDENGKPYKSSGGKMVWNEELKREIPEGWSRGTLGDVLNRYSNGISPSQIGDLPYTPMDILPCRKMSFHDVGSQNDANSSLIKYTKYTILFGAMRPYFHRVCIAPFDGITRTTVFTLSPKKESELGYAFETLNQDYAVDYANSHHVGTQQPYAEWENNLDKCPIPLPPNSIRNAYSEKTQSMIDTVIELNMENAELVSLRDFLLPTLMNGQVKVGVSTENEADDSSAMTVAGDQ